MSSPPSKSGRRRPAHRRTGLNRRSRKRLFGLLGAVAVAFGLIAWRLVAIQGFGSSGLERVSAEPTRPFVLPDLRGSILASNGDELAFSEMRPTVFADPHEIPPGQAGSEAATLAPILHLSVARLTTLMTAATTYSVLTPAPGTTDTIGARIEGLGLAGVGVEDQPVRYYPDGTLASPLIGFVNAAGQGAAGIEYRWNSLLTGQPGKVVEAVDPQGDPVPGTRTVDIPAKNGDDLLTTIDQALQYQTEVALGKAILASKAAGGTAIVEDRATGELLAVASLLADGKRVVETPLSSAFAATYEPGSVAKIVTLSAALASGTVTNGQEINLPESIPGSSYGLDVPDYVIHDDVSHPAEQMTPTAILAQSSNIGAAEIAQQLGPDRLYRYLQAYGLTQKTPIDFPGESPGILLTPANFSGSTIDTLAYGQGIGVSAAQMISVINTVANGGVYVPPRLVTATVDATGHEHALPTVASHRVIPAQVAATMTRDLEQVVSAGTGTAAAINGYAVAGKTGTAQVVLPDHTYSNTQFVSSFAGFAPAQDPQITAMVVIDTTPSYGAEAAAPAFATIVKDALLDLDVPSAGAQPAASSSAYPKVHGKVQVPTP